jgi:hypothetical protein
LAMGDAVTAVGGAVDATTAEAEPDGLPPAGRTCGGRC